VKLRVALLQLESLGADPAAAMEAGSLACREAARQGADVALFPELWQIGYAACPPGEADRVAWQDQAIDTGSKFVAVFATLAAELRMAIVISYLERHPGGPRNVATLIDQSGTIIDTYAKVHTCDFNFEAATTPGDGFRAVDLKLASGEVRIGLMICFDREFPEPARALMLDGAEIILVPNACPLPWHLLNQFRVRALENMTGMAMTNYAAPSDAGLGEPIPFDGHSIAISGICFDPAGHPVDDTLVQAGQDAGIFVAEFDLDELRAYRRRETWGDAYRKPCTYGALVRDNPVPEFRRPDSRRRPG
jgi:predicted amidohydrolase